MAPKTMPVLLTADRDIEGSVPVLHSMGLLSLILLSLCLWTSLPVAAQPRTPALDLAAMDRDADPCTDFYRYACGGWHDEHPMPPSETFWSKPFTQFAGRVDEYVRELVVQAAQGEAALGEGARLLGDHYAACMDEAAIEERGLLPLELESAKIRGMRSVEELAAVVGALQRDLSWYPRAGEPVLFVQTLWEAESGQTLLNVGPSGLGLGSPIYYLDKEHVGLLSDYQTHLASVFQALGDSVEAARSQAAAVVQLETRLAGGYLSKELWRNDPSATRNPLSLDALQGLTPSFRWREFFREHGLAETLRVNVEDPGYLRSLEEVLADTDLDTWTAYLRWQMVAERTAVLPRALRELRFSFFGRRLLGQQEPSERSQECFSQVERDLPSALGRLFVSRAFRPEMKEHAQRTFEAIQRAMAERLRAATWLSQEARDEALAKLAAMRLSLGHPEVWLDDPRLVVRRDDAYGNAVRAGHALRRINLGRVGSGHDPNWWFRPATWMGGYYHTEVNTIVVTAGMLLLYESGLDDPAVLYGGLGVLLAHELMHGFDPYGSGFDATGRVRRWWTDNDETAYAGRSACLAEQFSRLEYAPGIPINGRFVVSEQFAELAGTVVAWDAYPRATDESPQDLRHGLTSAQRFLVTQAQTWCAAATDDVWRAQVAGASSKAWAAPMVNGTVRNIPLFAEAFSCGDDSPMVLPPEKVCATW